jgi:hypothetical protein
MKFLGYSYAYRYRKINRAGVMDLKKFPELVPYPQNKRYESSQLGTEALLH